MRIIAKLNTKTIIPKATFFNTDRGLAWKRRRLYARLSFTFFYTKKENYGHLYSPYPSYVFKIN